jgi:hypothetical protein
MVLRTRGTRRGSVGRRQQKCSINLHTVVAQVQRPRHRRSALRILQPAAVCKLLSKLLSNLT